ncbi:hypothetical protein BwSH20_35220 [Bradyrhizobium ottawaense]|nr:hypothetical protein SG09_42900 [Bradyrhizobium ottawaense]GMO23515.1 hypothetical protein BwSH14_20850 [Bradyrhizobium ottawaense]GMO39178.1 hypothetical protein BwSF12_40490 [Bradyrhizobium ottawaense]GMO57062.1 hypothetical protein BwSG10_01420 [Bradyrhizobium ottawaense]GMO60781.1 hypothetical protein BwSG20_15540 [Bradyrhizobium ottawaense]
MESANGKSKLLPHTPSLRAQRSNPGCLRGKILDCFAALAMTARENDSISSRAPDAAQRPFDDALQSRGPCIDTARGCWVPALRSSAKSAAVRPGHGPPAQRPTKEKARSRSRPGLRGES